MAFTLRDLDLPLIPAGTVIVGSVIYYSSLLPGIMGVLTPSSVAFTMVTLILALMYLAKILSGEQLPGSVSTQTAQNYDAGCKPGLKNLIIAGFFSSVGTILAARYIYRITSGLFDPQRPLTLDVVVHHLPGFIKFIQDKTLWSLKGPFGSYSFGYELISSFPAYFFRSHWGLYLADFFSQIFFIGVLYYLTDRILRIWRPGVTFRIWPYIAVIWTSWFYLFRPDKLHVGKNGVFVNACILTSFALLLEIVFSESRDLSGKRYYSLLLTSALASGLALAVKPNALGFVLFLPLGLFFGLVIKGKHRGLAILRPALHSFAFLSVTFAAGGFFLFRNLLAYGSLVDPALSQGAFSMAIAANLTDPRFYILNKDIILLPIALAVFAGLLFKWWRTRKSEGRALFLMLFSAYYLVALISFVLTPFVVFTLGPKGATLDFRQGMMLVTAMLISFMVLFLGDKPVHADHDRPEDSALEKGPLGNRGTVFKSLASRVEHSKNAWGNKSVSWINIVLLGLFVLVTAVSWYWDQNPTKGMPGYEKFKNIPETAIYSYAQGFDGPMKIYSVGLFPYGLYDRKWENEIRFALSTDELFPEIAGKDRIKQVLRDYKPDYILISAAHGWPPEPVREAKKPLYAWMNAQESCFEEVYSDSGASAFRVRDDCGDI